MTTKTSGKDLGVEVWGQWFRSEAGEQRILVDLTGLQHHDPAKFPLIIKDKLTAIKTENCSRHGSDQLSVFIKQELSGHPQMDQQRQFTGEVNEQHFSSTLNESNLFTKDCVWVNSSKAK
jgi:hypothetical protein